MSPAELSAEATPQPPAPVRYDHLDGLRGLAIAGVVATHVGQAVPGLPPLVESFMIWGLRGVHLFFIVSALTLLLVTRPDKFVAVPFYTRRFLRIAPMFYAAALFYAAANLAGWMSVTSIPPSGLDVVLTFLFLHGFNPQGINNVVPGGWSIACEATFYAIFPLLLRFAGRVRNATLIAAGSLALTIAAVIVRQMVKGLLDSPSWGDFLHFNFAMNAWPFGLGVLVFALLKRFGTEARVIKLCGPGRLLCLAALLGMAFVGPQLPAGELLYAPILAAFVFAIAVRPEGLISARAMVYLGHISFSLYLVHFAILFVVEQMLPQTGVPLVDLTLLYGVALGASTLVASVFYYGVERPMIILGRSLTRMARADALSVVPRVVR